MKTKILFATSCLLVFTACSKDSGSKKGTPFDTTENVPVDEKSVGSELGQKLTSVPAWCQVLPGDETPGSGSLIERASFKNDSTMELKLQVVKADGLAAQFAREDKGSWSVDENRVTTKISFEGNIVETSFVPVFQTKDGKECYSETESLENGQPPVATGDNKTPAVKCACE